MRLPAPNSQMANQGSCANNNSNSGNDSNNKDQKDDDETASSSSSEAPKSEAKEAQGSSNMREVDYSEYEWMEHIEEFDKEVIRELEEQAFFEQCFMEASECSEEGYCDLDDLVEYDEEVDELGVCNLSSLGLAVNQILPTPLNPSAPEFIPKSFPLDESKTLEG